jgi:flagellar biosynthesis/type III secretory pathway protein FliH
VAAGKLTSDAEQKVLARLSARLDKLVNVTHPVARLRLARRLRAGIVRVSAGYVGVTPQQLRSDLRSGKTLAQEATDNGKTASGLEQAIESAVQTRLDKAVAAGKLTGEREQTMLSNLQTRLDALVNRDFAA